MKTLLLSGAAIAALSLTQVSAQTTEDPARTVPSEATTQDDMTSDSATADDYFGADANAEVDADMTTAQTDGYEMSDEDETEMASDDVDVDETTVAQTDSTDESTPRADEEGSGDDFYAQGDADTDSPFSGQTNWETDPDREALDSDETMESELAEDATTTDSQSSTMAADQSTDMDTGSADTYATTDPMEPSDTTVAQDDTMSDSTAAEDETQLATPNMGDVNSMDPQLETADNSDSMDEMATESSSTEVASADELPQVAEDTDPDTAADDLNTQELASEPKLTTEPRTASTTPAAGSSDPMMQDDTDALAATDLEGEESADPMLAQDDMSSDPMADEPVMTANASSSDLLASDYLGQTVYDSEGGKLARVDDVLLDDQGQAQAVILAAGGLFGLGGDSYAVDFDRVSATQEDGQVRLESQMSEDEIAQLREFDMASYEDQMGTMMLASEVRGQDLPIGESEETASVNDIMMSSTGQVDSVVIAYEGEQYVVPFDQLGVAEGDGGFYVDAEPSEISSFEVYEPRS
ncbi:PRC-barrel domain-containing protein [Parvularcula dongshanensis]|uniref:Sporulation protein YlmC with PRC-barrel domain n=1 Tax=Parvularcula dongshanensis TaxID=1173995 RepID=A0A840I1I3_9PROT|nr:PRC-barrel domain-containing protein [Parvularcula dongshanensis]MBB4658607.1 sporulation protein YlmC with PRC-barrel domain [Parvularcula dongshanensis]